MFSEKNQRKNAFFCNLTIRGSVKTVDDMTFKCPLNWSIRVLKEFIAKYDQQAVHTYKLESWNFFFAGRLLKEDEILQQILEKKDLLETYVFIINIRPNYKPTEQTIKSEDLEKEMYFMKKVYIENGLLEDYHRKLRFLGPETLTNETNIPNLPFLSTIPLMNTTFNERVEEIKKKRDSERFFEKPKDLPRMPQIDLNVSEDPEHRYYRWKLLSKLSVFYFFFSYMMKGNVYPHLLFFVLFIYYKIQMKDHERKIKNIQNARINLLIQNLSKKMENNNDLIIPNEPKDNKELKASELMKEEKLDLEKEMKKAKENSNQEISIFTKYYYILSEFFTCFTYSFFPTWYIELYIEEQPESYKAIVEKITKKSMNPNENEKVSDESKKFLDNLNNQLQQKKEQLNDLKQKLDELSIKTKQEESKEEEEIDPTDNINPENYKLIQKLQHLHKIEVMKEKFGLLKKNETSKNGEEEEESKENSSINTDPSFNVDYRRNSCIIRQKRSKSLEKDNNNNNI